MKIMIEFCALRAKTYLYRLDDDTEEKKSYRHEKMYSKKGDHI